MPILSLDRKDFIAGCADNDFESEIGLSPEGKGHNLSYKNGLLTPPPTAENLGTDLGTGETGIMAMGGNGSFGALLLATNSDKDGIFYKLVSTGITQTGVTANDTTRNYDKTWSDIITYNGAYLISSDTNIAQGASTGSSHVMDYDWYTTTVGTSALSAGYPHQMLVWEGACYISDGNTLRKLVGVTPSTPLTLPSGAGTAPFISAFIVHNNTFYLATVDGYNEDNQATSGMVKNYNMYVWDGINTTNTLSNKIPLDDKCYAMYSYNGSLLMFFEKYIAIWNGIGIRKIRTLSSAVYKTDISVRNEIMYIAEGNNILCYDGSKFWYLYGGSYDIGCIWNLYGDDLNFVDANKDVYKMDLDDFDGDGKAYSNWLEFSTNIIIRRVRIEFAEAMASGDFNVIQLANQFEETKSLTASYASQGAVRAVEFPPVGFKALSLQIRLNTFDNLIKKITIEYDYTKLPIKN